MSAISHPLIEGLFVTLPEPGTAWSSEDMAKWFRAAGAIFEILYPEPPGPVPADAAEAYRDGYVAASADIRHVIGDAASEAPLRGVSGGFRVPPRQRAVLPRVQPLCRERQPGRRRASAAA